MDSPRRFDTLAASLSPLREAGVVPAVARRLEPESRLVLDGLVEEIVGGAVAAYSETGNPEIVPELRDHLRDHLAEVCRLLEGERPGDFAFVRAHAEKRAAQRFPLDATHQTYRLLHRALATWIRDAALETAHKDAHVPRVVAWVSDFTIEYTGAVGSLATSSYVDKTRRDAEAEGDRRQLLFNTLLDGYDESDQRAARLLRRSGYLEQRQSYCVAVAQSVNPAEMESPPRAERMADAVADVMRNTPVRTIVGVRDNQVIMVMSATRRLSGWTAPQSLLADRVYPQLRMVGPAALIGLSNDVPSTAHIPRALSEARTALEHASVDRRVMPYSQIPFPKMLISFARDEILAAMPGWVDSFTAADSRGRLAETLSAYADCDMNVQKTAKQLQIHPNTIYARIQKIHDVTGLNPLSYRALTEMLLALECRDQRSAVR